MGTGNTIVRGGVGIFSGRPPYVWMSNAFTNTGLEQVTLLEEPQAAFYAWLAKQGDAWRNKVKVGDILLVCDVGGGTTDFTLIAVTEQDGTPVPACSRGTLGRVEATLAAIREIGAPFDCR